jgi:hypothetical protein
LRQAGHDRKTRVMSKPLSSECQTGLILLPSGCGSGRH